MASEFDLIRKYFTRSTRNTILGVGDDCALVALQPEMHMAISTDMLVSGTHFQAHADARSIGHKVLAVNLSDLAAMGAKPRWVVLAAALPEADEAWIEAFADGFFALADQHEVDVIGGDTTRGPLTFCATIMGEVPQDAALRRDGARIGDDIWISGTLGGAAMALAHLQGKIHLEGDELDHCLERMHRPQPRVELGLTLSLRWLGHAAIDISDGLIQDLGHILARSGVGAEVHFDKVPLAPALADEAHDMREALGLAGGDDYELCFTAHQASANDILEVGNSLGLPLTRIGSIVEGSELKILDASGNVMTVNTKGFDHFA